MATHRQLPNNMDIAPFQEKGRWYRAFIEKDESGNAKLTYADAGLPTITPNETGFTIEGEKDGKHFHAISIVSDPGIGSGEAGETAFAYPTISIIHTISQGVSNSYYNVDFRTPSINSSAISWTGKDGSNTTNYVTDDIGTKIQKCGMGARATLLIFCGTSASDFVYLMIPVTALAGNFATDWTGETQYIDYSGENTIDIRNFKVCCVFENSYFKITLIRTVYTTKITLKENSDDIATIEEPTFKSINVYNYNETSNGFFRLFSIVNSPYITSGQ